MSRTVLIVDDSLTVRMDLVEAFQSAGFETIACGSASDARAAIAKESIAMAVLDVILPDGDGCELLAEIRARSSARTPVLMLSTEAEVKDRVRGLSVGADDYVGKPYDTGYVVARARELLRPRSHRAGPAPTSLLVIDDSPTFREELKRALEAAGYSVATAPTGEQGLSMAAVLRPAAVLVDNVMPGIDGATIIRRIRLDAALWGTPCLLLTASEGPDAELRALDAGADAFARKDSDLSVVLARLAAVLRRAPEHDAASSSLLGPKRILAVDDSSTFLQELSSTLRGDGYDVVCARSGEEALEMLAAQDVDCILLDVMMPGLGGLETCRRIKSSPAVRDIPLIMLTGLEDREAMLDGLGVGADDYISKTHEFEVLKARVRAQLRRKQFEDEHRRVRDELLRSELEAREARAGLELAETRALLVGELERKNKELESFSYSVSHDLRAPLRSIHGFSEAILEEYSDRLDEQGRDYLRRVCAAARRMGELIDDMLELSRVTRAELRRTTVDITKHALAIAAELRRKDPHRRAVFEIEDRLVVQADDHLVRVVLDNLLGNAWKFTSKADAARIELGRVDVAGQRAFVVRDNGAGFDMAYARKLFIAFQRLHRSEDFPGTGIGLATVHRIVDRHGGRVWAEGTVGRGASFYFTLAPGGSAGSRGDP